jgi:hypothetical protein
LRIRTWNMEKYPLPTTGKGPEVTAFLDAALVCMGLFTEVNAGWQTPHGRIVLSPAGPSAARRIGGPASRPASR